MADKTLSQEWGVESLLPWTRTPHIHFYFLAAVYCRAALGCQQLRRRIGMAMTAGGSQTQGTNAASRQTVAVDNGTEALSGLHPSRGHRDYADTSRTKLGNMTFAW